MTAIFKREFRALFCNVTGWIFIGVTMAFYGLYFTLYQLMQGYGSIGYTLGAIVFVMLLTAPILTMRIFSEERKNKTDQLIMTAPVSTMKIVLGKYFALAATFTICVGLMALSPLLLSFFGEVPFLTGYVALLGFYFYGLTCLAIGMFASSLTENQLISAVLSFVLLFLGYVMTNLTNMISSTGNLLTKILNCYDLYTPLNDFLGGNLNLVNLAYYISVILLCLFLTYEGIQKRRWSVSSRKISFSVFSSVTFALGLVIIVLLNVGVRAIPSTYTALDFTESGLYSLSDTSKEYLKTLDQDVTLYYYNTKSASDDTVKKLLTNYKTASKHIKVKYVNPTTNPDFASQFNEEKINSDSVVVATENAHKVIAYNELYELTTDYSSMSYVPTGFDGEGQITSAIHYVTSEDRPVVYTLSGHNETEIGGSFAEALDKANIDVENLNFLAADAVPDDADVLLIHAPQMDFSNDDVKKLESYLDAGGQLIVTLDFKSVNELPKFTAVLEKYGITVKNGIVAEGDSDAYYQSQYYLLPTVSGDEVNGDLAGSLSVFVPLSLAFGYEDKEGFTYTPLMTSSEESYLKSFASAEEAVSTVNGQQVLDEVKKEDGDEAGPFTLAMNVTADNGSSIYLYGSAYTFTESANEIVSGRNQRLFGQLITTICSGGEDNSVVVPVKSFDAPSLTVTDYAIHMYGMLWGILLPLASIILGIVIFVVRRRK